MLLRVGVCLARSGGDHPPSACVSAASTSRVGSCLACAPGHHASLPMPPTESTSGDSRSISCWCCCECWPACVSICAVRVPDLGLASKLGIQDAVPLLGRRPAGRALCDLARGRLAAFAWPGPSAGLAPRQVLGDVSSRSPCDVVDRPVDPAFLCRLSAACAGPSSPGRAPGRQRGPAGDGSHGGRAPVGRQQGWCLIGSSGPGSAAERTYYLISTVRWSRVAAGTELTGPDTRSSGARARQIGVPRRWESAGRLDLEGLQRWRRRQGRQTSPAASRCRC